jgi:hypothetical protein
MDEHLPLVVTRPPSIKILATHNGLKGWRMPLAQRVGWLNIEMPIDKNGRLRGRVEPFGIDQRMTLGRYDPNVFQPDSAQMISEPRGAVPNIRCMVWLDANTGEADEVRESPYEA